MSKTKNVFISHVHEDDEQLGKIKKLLQTKGYEIRDASVDSRKPNNAKSESYIKNEILAPKIQWAGSMIVLISPDTASSEWVNWEIDHAHKNDTQVVGVFAHGASESDLPEAFERFGDALVGWQADRIIDAIEGRLDSWQDPSGKPVGRDRIIERYSCK